MPMNKTIITIVAYTLCAVSVSAQTFVDQTTNAGVSYVQWDGIMPAGVSSELFMMSGGAAVGDFDNDGWPDLYVTRINAPNRLFRNLKNGTFEEVGAARQVALNSYSTGCAWADIDNDGDLDLYVLTTEPATRHHLFINDGTGMFTEQAIARGAALETNAAKRPSTSISFGDYNRDGWLDVIVASWSRNTFATGGERTLLLKNTGNGYFVDETIPANVFYQDIVWGFTPRFADVDDDGWPDILIAADFSTSKLYHNNQDGTFTDITAASNVGTDENGMGATIGDLENDGDLDWFVTAIFDPAATCDNVSSCNWGNSGNRMYANNGTGVFSDSTDFCGVRDGYWGWGATFLDYDNDGDADLTMTNGVMFPFAYDDPFNFNPLRFWDNDGTGQMTEISASLGLTDARSGKGILTFDYDRDGDLDIFVTNNSDTPVLYRNDMGNAMHWLQIQLQGYETNRSGVGARIYIYSVGTTNPQMHEVSASSNYMSHNDIVEHFGLSTATSADVVRVDWPRSGLTSILRNVPADQRLTIYEPHAGDFDGDNLINFNDAQAFIACLAGPNNNQSASPCRVGDMNTDNDIDLQDVQLWQMQFQIP